MRRMRVRVWLAWFAAWGAAAAVGYAADEAPAERQQEEVRATINEIKQNKLVTILELPADDEQAFVTMYTHWEEVRWEFRKRRASLMEELSAKMAEVGEGRELVAILDDIDTTDRDARASEERLRIQFRSILSMDQYAKLLLFEDNFNRNLRRLVQDRQRLEATEAAESPAVPAEKR